MIDWKDVKWDSYKDNPIKRFKKSGKPVTGKVRKKGLSNLSDILIISYLDGKEHGPFHIEHGGTSVYQLTAGSFKNGKIDGPVKRYYDDSGDTLHSTGRMEISRLPFTNDDGKLEEHINFYFIGKVKYYTREGVLHLIVSEKEKNGEIVEVFEKYYPNGQVKLTYTMIDRDIEGKKIEYYQEGTLKKEQEHSKGEKNGLCREYYPDSSLKSEGIYNNGYKDGKWSYYYQNGKKEREEFYDTPDDYKIISNRLTPMGDDVFRMASEGNKHGEWRYFNENGNCTKIENYKNGLQHGITTTFDRSGKPVKHKYSKGKYLGKESKTVSFFKGLKDY